MGAVRYSGLSPTALLIGAGALLAAVLLASRQAAADLGARAGGAVADMATGLISGIGKSVNESLINPAVAGATGEPGQTLGGWVHDLVHGKVDGTVPKTADEATRLLQGEEPSADPWRATWG